MAPPHPSRGMYPADGGKFITFPSRRSVVHSTKGIVSTASPLASQAGLKILQDGGNAADAAIAAAAVLNLVDPSMTGIGGDAFCLFYDSTGQQVHALNGSGRSPAHATLDDVCAKLGVVDCVYGTIPPTSALSVTIPGAAAAWVDTVEMFGSRTLSLGQVLAPAIKLAEEGCPVSEISSYMWAGAEEKLRSTRNGDQLLKIDLAAPSGYRAPRAGDVYQNALLAATFRLLADEGKLGFYEGKVAGAIVDIIQHLGGCMTLDDLKDHGLRGSEVVEPLAMRLRERDGREIDLWEAPPNSQGIVAHMALGILQALEDGSKLSEFQPDDHNSSRYLHALIEALRIAFTDGSWFISDPHVTKVDPLSFISKEYLAQRAKLFNPDRAIPMADHDSPVHNISDTIYLAVTDSDGNACSLVNSVADTFGSYIVPRDVGFVLHSRGAGFHLNPEHPNAYAPRKRPYNTIIPALITNAHDRSLHTVLGVMGGAMQPQGHIQVLLNMLLFGMNPQVALDAPRICVGISLPGKSTDPSKKVDNTIYLEEGISEEIARELEKLGHAVKFVGGMARSLFGRGQVIRVFKDEVTAQRIYSAGSDMRGDGAAAPFL